MKKLFNNSMLALILGLVMLFSLVPVKSFAALQDGSITVKGIPATDTVTVTAYQVVAAKYENTENTNQVTGYKNIAPAEFADPAAPTAAEWKTLIAQDFTAATPAPTPIALTKQTDGSYKADGLEAGLYVVFITGSSEGNIYNPLLAGINYQHTTEGTDDLIDSEITLPSDFQLNDTILYAKSNQPEVTKKAVDPTPEDQSSGSETLTTGNGTVNPKGNGTEIGEKIDFTVTTTIPSYSEKYTEVVFKITDTLDAGITPPQAADVTIKVGDNIVTPAADTYTLTVEGQQIKVVFNSAYVLGLRDKTAAQRAVEMTYKAALNDSAGRNFDANKNDVKIEYSHNPDDKDDLKTDEDRTYHYTFDIDGKVSGKETGSWETYEITKHHDLEKTGEGSYEKDKKPLQGAKFGLWKAAAQGAEPDWTKNPEAFKTVDTTADGRMYFGGLDEGIYYVKEITAPAGYSLNTEVNKVEITAEYNEDGTLKTYSVKINNTVTSTYEATYNKENGEPEITIKPLDQSTIGQWLINNVKLGELPSTGGMGTYLFIAVGALFITGAIYVSIIIIKRKRQLNK